MKLDNIALEFIKKVFPKRAINGIYSFDDFIKAHNHYGSAALNFDFVPFDFDARNLTLASFGLNS